MTIAEELPGVIADITETQDVRPTLLPTARDLYFLNPMAGLLTLYHDVLYWGRMPSPELLGGMLLAAAAIYLAGYALFRRYAAIFPEIV